MSETYKALPTDKREAKRMRVIRAASAQMNERGATSISLSGVADSVGLSRNALYYYFKNRLDLVYACYLEAGEATAADLKSVLAENTGVLDKLRRYIELTLLGANAERAVLSDFESLPEPQRTQIYQLNQSNLEILVSLIEEGIANHEIKTVNPASRQKTFK